MKTVEHIGASKEPWRNSLAWGSAFSSLDYPQITELPKYDQFRYLAWTAACPTAESVWRTYEQMGKVDWVIARYNDTNGVTKHVIWPLAATTNPGLYRQFTKPRLRNFEEPIGKYEPESVPDTHRDWLSGMSTLPGYSGARLLTLMANASTPEKIQTNKPVMAALRESIRSSASPYDFIAKLSQHAYNMNIHPAKILEHVIEGDKVKEEGYQKEWKNILSKLAVHAPPLYHAWKVFERLNPPPMWRNPIKAFLHFYPNFPREFSFHLGGFQFETVRI